MPTVRPARPPDPRSHAHVVRTESLKSERSDKRVSFNKDVGVKHIPRGHKSQPGGGGGGGRAGVRAREGEWANCSQVHREPVSLSSQELEQEAEDLVRLLDQVDCGSSSSRGRSFPLDTRSLDRPNKGRAQRPPTAAAAQHTYNNVLFNNVRSKNTNIVNGEPRGRQRPLAASRTTNPIARRVKGDVNRTTATTPTTPNGGSLAHRHRSVDHLPDTDQDSPPLPRRNSSHHKSVPDLHHYNNNNNNRGVVGGSNHHHHNNNDNNYSYNNYKYHSYREPDPVVNYKSVDDLYDGVHRPTSLGRGGCHKSVEDVSGGLRRRPPGGGRLQGYKSLGHLPSACPSSEGEEAMPRPEGRRPARVGNIIRMFNQDAEEDPRRQGRPAEAEEAAVAAAASQRGALEPDRFRRHNDNQPFSYTGATPLASVRAVRRLSPPREPAPAPVYAQVTKREGRPGRDAERSLRRDSRQEREYSAKIIITDGGDDDDRLRRRRPSYRDSYDDDDDDLDDVVDDAPYRDAAPKNQYDDDDDAYESYQVPEDSLRRLIHDDLEEYKEHSSNNINMSSVGVQTEAVPKAPSRSRGRSQRSAAPPPKQEQTGHPPGYRLPRQQDYYASHRSQTTIHNNLTSASLVRQVNHGFGRVDRSPSPPPRVSTARQPRRNVVPLLSDTSDSEAEHRRQTVDPLARIRDQVMQREKLQEEEEEEEEAAAARAGRLGMPESGAMPYRTDEMTPLTIDEVDALSLVMEDTGKKSLVVSNQAQSSSVSRASSNHRSRRTEAVSERTLLQEQQRGKDGSLPRTRRASRERGDAPREGTPTRRDKDAPPRKERDAPGHKEPPPAERSKKNNLEKERASKAAKQQQKEEEKKKEKKTKKKIKIKFFYDPRPQDDPTVDPLSRFTEFRGTSSDERVSPPDARRREEEEQEQPDDREDDPEGWLEERKEEYRPDRSRRRSEEREVRALPDVLEDAATPPKERRVGSRERLDGTPRPNKRSAREARTTTTTTAATTTRERSHESYGDYKRRGSKDSKDSHDNRSSREAVRRPRDDPVSYEGDEQADERRDGLGGDERGSPDGRAGRSLSDKYRSGPLYDPPDDEAVDDPPPPPEAQPPTEEDEKQQKIMRQRSKFFSVLMSDGRNKNTSKTTTSTSKTKNTEASPVKNKKPPAPSQPPAQPNTDNTPEKAEKQAPAKKKPAKKRRAWPWALLGLRSRGRGAAQGPPKGSGPGSSRVGSSRVSSRASSRASSRSSHRPRRPSVRASKIRRDGQPPWLGREHLEEADKGPPPPRQWESSTLNRAELRARKDTSHSENRGYSTVQRPTTRKYSGESSASSGAQPPQVSRTTSFKQRYFGDTDIESNHGVGSGVGNYRSLPNRSSRSAHKNTGKGRRSTSGPRGMSPPVVGSAGSSLQSSESEVDSHGGSHASRASKASHVSTGSNRSVFLHATAVADIPVRRGPEEVPSERNVSRQSRKVSRSFSLLAPWKPRHYREKFEVEYDNREVKEARGEASNSKGALPPRPPRRPAPEANDKKVNRSQSMYKDSRLATWLRRRKNKEAKGI